MAAKRSLITAPRSQAQRDVILAASQEAYIGPEIFTFKKEDLPLISPLSQRGSGAGSVQRYGGAISVI